MNKKINHLKFNELPVYERGRGIKNHLIASKQIGANSLHSGITFMPPMTSVPAHSHNAEEQVTVLEGTLRIVLNGGSKELICNKYTKEREMFNHLMKNKEIIDLALEKGAVKARIIAKEVLRRVRKNIGY